MRSSAEWQAWDLRESDFGEVGKHVPEIISDLEACEREREEMRHACLTRDEMHWATTARYEAEIKRLGNALQALYDEQNGPPLIRHEARWQAAMDEAERLQRELP